MLFIGTCLDLKTDQAFPAWPANHTKLLAKIKKKVKSQGKDSNHRGLQDLPRPENIGQNEVTVSTILS